MFELFSNLEYVQAYIDDLLVTSCSPFEKHLEHLEKVLSWLNDVGLNLLHRQDCELSRATQT